MDPRKLFLCRGKDARSRAADLLAEFEDERVLVLETGERARSRAVLGQSFDAVTLDFTRGVDAELLGVASGLVWGGGALIVCLADEVPVDEGHVVWPYEVADVGRRFIERFCASLVKFQSQKTPLSPPIDPEGRARGTEDQRALVAALAERVEHPGSSVVVAGRGRGKSAALGLLAATHAHVVATGPNREAVDEILKRAPHARFIPAFDLAYKVNLDAPLLLVDEAAQLPVPALNQIAARSSGHVVYATTARGYEGTGRGFLLRFVAGLKEVARFELHDAIRFMSGDDVERFTHEVLGVNLALPAAVPGRPRYRVLDRTRDGALFEQAFALLVHAHYRTTPSDLARMLDAPNLKVHVLTTENQVQAAALFAEEGGLDDDVTRSLTAGARLRGHALAESFAVHGGQTAAAKLALTRSIRTAVHPARRRAGLGRQLVLTHFASSRADVVGTLFGADPSVVAFRQALGFSVCRVGSSRGSRTGEPSVMMARAKTAAGRAVIAKMRERLSLALPLQLHFLDVEHEIAIDDTLRKMLFRDLPSVPPLSDDEVGEGVAAYARGARPYEAACVEIEIFAAAQEKLEDVLRWRALERRSWVDTMQRAQLGSVKATMRAVRRAVRALV